MIDPESGLVWFVFAGTLGVISKAAWNVSNRIGPKITLADLRPALPPRLPLPIFMYEKPELLAELRRRKP